MPRSPKKVTKETRITEVEDQQPENPIPQLVREYLNEGSDYPDALRELHYVINVQKYQRDGRAVTVAGRVYEDLEKLPYQLGERFGTSRFKLFIKALDGNEAPVAIVKILDYPIEWDGDQDPADREDDGLEDPDDDEDHDIRILEMKHQHEKELKQMELQSQLMITIANAKGGGGPKMSEMLQLLETGIALGQGRPVPEVTAEGDNGSIMKIIDSPLGRVLTQAIMENMSKGPKAAPAAATNTAPDPLE